LKIWECVLAFRNGGGKWQAASSKQTTAQHPCARFSLRVNKPMIPELSSALFSKYHSA
jgi:hypothetical protein